MLLTICDNGNHCEAFHRKITNRFGFTLCATKVEEVIRMKHLVTAVYCLEATEETLSFYLTFVPLLPTVPFFFLGQEKLCELAKQEFPERTFSSIYPSSRPITVYKTITRAIPKPPNSSRRSGTLLVKGLYLNSFYQFTHIYSISADFSANEVELLRFMATIYPRHAMVEELEEYCFPYLNPGKRASLSSKISRINDKAINIIGRTIISSDRKGGYYIDF
ncbi:MAG: hypothetical protein MJ078_01810 [Clostridia bacterium]|nr:hypothetical protein [Clostridia bacterium]